MSTPNTTRRKTKVQATKVTKNLILTPHTHTKRKNTVVTAAKNHTHEKHAPHCTLNVMTVTNQATGRLSVNRKENKNKNLDQENWYIRSVKATVVVMEKIQFFSAKVVERNASSERRAGVR